MSKVTAAPPARARVADREHALARDVLGLPQVLFCIVTGAAPLAAMLFNVPVAVSGGGYAVPAAFIIATVALTIFSVGYIEMARRVTPRRVLHVHHPRPGPVVGMGVGLPDRVLLHHLRGGRHRRGRLLRVDVGRRRGSASRSRPGRMSPLLALMTAFAWFHIELTAKILGVALVSEVLR